MSAPVVSRTTDMTVTKVPPLVVALELHAFCYPSSRSLRRLDSLHQRGTLPRESLHDEDECLDMDFFLLDWIIIIGRLFIIVVGRFEFVVLLILIWGVVNLVNGICPIRRKKLSHFL